MQIASRSGSLSAIMVALYGYLERGIDKAFKLHINNTSYFEISTSLF